MRPLIYLFPHDRLDVGGNSAQVRLMAACASVRQTSVAYYGDRIEGHPYLDEILMQGPADGVGRGSRPIFIIHWGPDIAMLLDKLQQHDVIYVAHSTGWGMALPPKVPILCVSRHTMAYWGRHAPNSYIALMPNIVERQRSIGAEKRDIDVLVQVRKSSKYLLEALVPALKSQCNVVVLDGWVSDLSVWFERSKVYLYDSLEHWVGVGATEGFGLPPLEAMMHGCTVFSGVNDALADYLDPGFNCHKLRVHSVEWDTSAILRAVNDATAIKVIPDFFRQYAADDIINRWRVLLEGIEIFFDHVQKAEGDIEDIWQRRRPTWPQRAKRAIRILTET